MNSKHEKTIKLICEMPIRSDVKWADIESLFKALGAQITEGRGSRMRVYLNGVSIVFHRPHPRRETDKGALVSVRKFLKMAGIL